MSGLLFPFGFLLLTLANSGTAQQADSNCNFYQDLVAGQKYYVTSPGYPDMYRGQHNCQWIARGTGPIKLTCTMFDIPQSFNCGRDNLAVEINGSEIHKYCGKQAFNITSQGPEMKITFTSYYNPFFPFSGGRFLCELQQEGNESGNGDGGNDADDDCECGHKNPRRIVGGTETGVNEYPSMVGIVDNSIGGIACGGSIISPYHILTAAHCVVDRDINNVGVLVGDHDISTGSETNATWLTRASEFIIHPMYKSFEKGNDIAVVRTAEKIKYSMAVGSSCLPFEHANDSFSGSIVTLLGWGTTDFGGPTSDVLMGVNLNVISNTRCKRTYSDLQSSQLCTQTPDKDACQLDSGGPVLWQNPTTGRLVLVGIISGGKGCDGDEPALNTRVGSFLPWIQSVTRGQKYCKVE